MNKPSPMLCPALSARDRCERFKHDSYIGAGSVGLHFGRRASRMSRDVRECRDCPDDADRGGLHRHRLSARHVQWPGGADEAIELWKRVANGRHDGFYRGLTRQMSRASRRHNLTGRCRVGSIRMLGGLNSELPRWCSCAFSRMWRLLGKPSCPRGLLQRRVISLLSRRPDCHLQQGGTAECGQ